MASTALTWAWWPVAAAPLSARGQALWSQVLRGWAGGARLAILPSGTVAGSRLASWASAVQLRGLGPALAVAPESVSVAWLVSLPTPLLVVVQGSADSTPDAWTQAIAHLARHREARHRWALLDAPLCAIPQGCDGPVQGDLTLAAAPSRTADPRCHGCALASSCSGPQRYRGPVKPQQALVTNQFDLELDGRGPVVGELAADGQLRTLTLLAGQVEAHDVELALARGQLYRDQSAAARLGDFASELLPLIPGPGAPNPGPWTVSREPAFAKEELALLTQLAELRGLVVDVGAGPVRYIAALQQAMLRGEVAYLAVEPDLGHLRHSAAALPQGTFVRGVGEQLPVPSHTAAAVLMLRSWNHLRDPAEAVREAARVLQPGGQLLIVDNVVFGLVRDAEQLARAHAIPVAETPFEHFRNDDATDAWRQVEQTLGARARCTALKSVGPGTSNQWLLVVQVDPA